LLLTIKLPQTLDKILVVGHWPAEARESHCLLFPLTGYALARCKCAAYNQSSSGKPRKAYRACTL